MIDEVWSWPRRRPDDPVMVLAHRGGAGAWRENTLDAFTAALRLGADGVELDVRRTSDGALVVHHDPEIPGVGPIHDLKGTDLPAWVPSLDQALETCAGAVVNVELKNTPVEPGFDPSEKAAAQVVSALSASGLSASGLSASGLSASGRSPGGAPAHVIVSSFWPATLEAVRQAGPDIPLGLLVHPLFDVGEWADQAATLGCRALHPFADQVTPELVDLVHDLGMSVITWTVNDPGDLVTVAAAGVDGVISDRVTEAREALGRL
jgi:glycerophosphoryl diester phosphodiesterase